MNKKQIPRIILALLVAFSCFSSAVSSPTAQPGTGIEGIVTVGPTHGGPTRPGIPDSKPLANATFVVENGKGAVASFTTDDQGQLRISLAPGQYVVSMKDKKVGIGRYGPFDVNVVAGQITKVEWQCDTGMR